MKRIALFIMGSMLLLPYTLAQNLSEVNAGKLEDISSNHSRQTRFIPNDSLLNSMWHLSYINAFDAWNVTMGSSATIFFRRQKYFDTQHI